MQRLKDTECVELKAQRKTITIRVKREKVRRTEIKSQMKRIDNGVVCGVCMCLCLSVSLSFCVFSFAIFQFRCAFFQLIHTHWRRQYHRVTDSLVFEVTIGIIENYHICKSKIVEKKKKKRVETNKTKSYISIRFSFFRSLHFCKCKQYNL